MKKMIYICGGVVLVSAAAYLGYRLMKKCMDRYSLDMDCSIDESDFFDLEDDTDIDTGPKESPEAENSV